MPVFVPLLRLFMLFLNIYDSFKTLKPPPLSARTGRTSARAAAQRKRAMKGCLSVWIVWCCFVAYETSVERIVWIFIPFYGELKMLAITFLIVTRAKGAEPIYLHIIRPLIKPYAKTFDIIHDLAYALGELILLLTNFPVRLVLSWWHRLFPSSDDDSDSEDSDEKHVSGSRTQYPLYLRDVSSSSIINDADRRDIENSRSARRFISQPSLPKRPVGDTIRHFSADSCTERAYGSSSAIVDSRKTVENTWEQTIRPDSRREIWHPSTSYNSDPEHQVHVSHTSDDAYTNTPRTSTPSPESNLDDDKPILVVEEWRLYPPFPSAYPPTPLPASQRLPIRQASIDATVLEEDESEGHPIRSSLPPREPLNVGFVSASSDEDSLQASTSSRKEAAELAQEPTGNVDDKDNEADEESDVDDDDNEFDVTLRTPQLPPYGSLRTRLAAHANKDQHDSASESSSSLPGKSTALTTTNRESTARTRTASESSGSASISDSSSVAAGQKRALSATYARRTSGTRPTIHKPRRADGHPSRSHGLHSKASLEMSQHQIFRGLSMASHQSADVDDSTSDDGGNLAPSELTVEHAVKKRKVQNATSSKPSAQLQSGTSQNQTEVSLSRRSTRLQHGKLAGSRTGGSSSSIPVIGVQRTGSSRLTAGSKAT